MRFLIQIISFANPGLANGVWEGVRQDAVVSYTKELHHLKSKYILHTADISIASSFEGDVFIM